MDCSFPHQHPNTLYIEKRNVQNDYNLNQTTPNGLVTWIANCSAYLSNIPYMLHIEKSYSKWLTYLNQTTSNDQIQI